MNRPKIVSFSPPKSIEAYPMGATYKAGHLIEENSGWRTFKPVIDYDRCIDCLQCFLVCPDGAIDKSEERIAVDYRFCKGCGICVKQCKVDGIQMVKED